MCKGDKRPYFGRILLLLCLSSSSGLSIHVENYRQQKTFNYFAIGSNMVPATMTSLRNLSPISATASVLSGYTLAFNIPGNTYIEPSAASCCPGRETDCIHGVLYELSEKDFARLGFSEGVPFAYRWKRCQVHKYKGDGYTAGRDALLARDESSKVSAFVLTSSSSSQTDSIPPSRSYMEILQDAATFWRMDRKYQDELARVEMSNMNGISGILLDASKVLNPKITVRRPEAPTASTTTTTKPC